MELLSGGGGQLQNIKGLYGFSVQTLPEKNFSLLEKFSEIVS